MALIATRDDTLKMQRRLELDGLRAIACLIVLVLHCLYFTVVSAKPYYDFYFVGVPKVGVWLFFSLSAFLLTQQLIASGSGLRSISNYLVGRCSRILIPFAVAVALYRYSGIGVMGISDWGDAWRVISMQQASGHLWTIPPEFSFYLVLPPILFAIVYVRHCGIVGSLLLGALVISISTAFWQPWQTPYSSTWMPWYAMNFGSGVLAALAVSFLPHPGRVPAALIGCIAASSILAIIILSKTGLFDGDPASWLLNKHYIIGPLWAVVTYSVFVWRPAFLRTPVLALIGRWSFSIYLFHLGVAMWIGTLMPEWLAFPASIVASIAVGAIGYAFLERPTYTLRKYIDSAIWDESPSPRVQTQP